MENKKIMETMIKELAFIIGGEEFSSRVKFEPEWSWIVDLNVIGKLNLESIITFVETENSRFKIWQRRFTKHFPVENKVELPTAQTEMFDKKEMEEVGSLKERRRIQKRIRNKKEDQRRNGNICYAGKLCKAGNFQKAGEYLNRIAQKDPGIIKTAGWIKLLAKYYKELLNVKLD